MAIPLNPLLAQRFSARTYKPVPIPDADLISILEAARWAPSSYNDQPWTFILARRQDTPAFEKMLSCMGGNADWCKNAGALLACIATKSLTRHNRPNPHAWHDIGLAVMSMEIQGVSLGLQMREMAGIERDKVRELYQVPETHDVVSGLAIGVPADPMPEGRSRKSLDEMVFEDHWGQSAKIG